MIISFTVRGIAQPGGSKRAFPRKGGGVIVVDANPKVKPWREVVAYEARVAMGNRLPITGPVKLAVAVILPRPKTHFDRWGTIKPLAPWYHTKRPDATKMLRAIEDAMTRIVWHDDAQVAIQEVMKFYCAIGQEPCVSVRVSELANSIIPAAEDPSRLSR